MKKYQRHFFQRQAQVFPDVLLKANRNGQEIILGIELKGWYLLAKEGAPNFRFTTTPDACSEADIVVVVPWVLNNVLSGTPTTYKPFVIQAKYAARYRNYWVDRNTGRPYRYEYHTAPGCQPLPAEKRPHRGPSSQRQRQQFRSFGANRNNG